jgi:hypothetical protein
MEAEPPGDFVVRRHAEHFDHDFVPDGRGNPYPGELPEPMNPFDDPNAYAAEEENDDPVADNMQQRIHERYIRRGIHAAQGLGLLPRQPAWVGQAIEAGRIAGGLAGYGPEAAALAEMVTPERVAVVGGAIKFFRWIYDQGVMQRNVAAQQRLAALAAKYPRVLGRTNFASAGNAPLSQSFAQRLPWRYLQAV